MVQSVACLARRRYIIAVAPEYKRTESVIELNFLAKEYIMAIERVN